jgi:hypothetical protein
MTTPYLWLNDEKLVGQAMIGAPSNVMQFTGLKDKNDIEIYEGDICLNESGRIAKIIYLDSGACFDAVALNEKGDSKGFEPQMWSYRIRVIANIYQNPELLESK